MRKDWIEQVALKAIESIPKEQLAKLSEEQILTLLKNSYPQILSFFEEEVEKTQGR